MICNNKNREKAQRASKSDSAHQHVAFGSCGSMKQKFSQSCQYMQMLDVSSMRKRPSSRDTTMQESQMKRSMRLYVMNSHQAQDFIGKPTTIKQLTPGYAPLIKVNQVKVHESQGQLACNKAKRNQDGNVEHSFTKIFHQDKSHLNTQPT